MSNKGLLVDNNMGTGDIADGIVGTVNRVYVSLLQLAANELGRISMKSGLTRDMYIDYRESLTGFVEIVGTKGKKRTFSPQMTTNTRSGRWPLWVANTSSGAVAPSSLLTEAEAKLMLADRPDSISVQRAVCVLARSIGPDASMAFENFYSNQEVDLVSEEDVLKIIQLDRARVGRLLRVLPSAVDDYRNRTPEPERLRYSNLFGDRLFNRNDSVRWEEPKPMTPIGAEKLVLSFWLVMAVAIREHDALMESLSFKPAQPIVGKSTDLEVLYDAADKVIGKACLVGMPTPPILAKAKTIYESMCSLHA